ncbi:DUF4440 domain-containing protein [Sphingomonas sp.]|uniref:YybH family protein n=1 Tax=Sphingomonas sp. TaxID=28214 RepID=UPI00286E73B0|nr:DUF4440 domain-containing protein [Sphingomonas sp.]
MKQLLAVMLCASALTACDAMGAKDPAIDTAAVEQQLKGIEGQWMADYNARDAVRLAEHYAPDASLANPGAPLVSDALGRRAAIATMVSDPNFRLQFASDRTQVAKSGDLAYTRGHFTMQSTDPATKQPRSDTGSYLTVWQKQADGSWKAVEDFITPGAPAAATAPAPAG